MSRRRIMDDPIIISTQTNAPVMKVLWDKGVADREHNFSHGEAKSHVTDNDVKTMWINNSDITHFNEFLYFTGITGNGLGSTTFFYNCSNLETLKLPESMIKLGDWYSYQKGLFDKTKIKHLKIPDKVTVITTDCFRGMNELKTLVWGKSLTFPGNACYYSYCGFVDCYELENIINLPENPSGVGTGLGRSWEACFNNCRKLNIIDYPIIFKPEVIGSNYLSNTHIRQGIITFPYATAIYQRVFYYDDQVCKDYDLQQGFIVNLPNVKILGHGWNFGASLINVGDTCETVADLGIQDCRDFRFLGTVPPTKASTRTNYPSARVFVPESALNAYKTATNWNSMASKIKAFKEQPSNYFCTLSNNTNVPSDYTIVSYITNGETALKCGISSLGYIPKRYSQILLDWEQSAVRDGNVSTRTVFWSASNEYTIRIENGAYNYNPLIYRPNTTSAMPNYNAVKERSVLFNSYVTGEDFCSRSILKLGNAFIEYHGKSWQWDEAEYDYVNPIAFLDAMTDRSYKVYRLCMYEPLANCTNYDDSSQYEIVRDYIPVKRNSDGVYGLYERLTNVFYPSTNTYPFSGPTE